METDQKVVEPVKSPTHEALASAGTNSKKEDHTKFYGRRNARRFAVIDTEHVEWRDKGRIQKYLHSLVHYCKYLESEVARLTEKSNSVIAPPLVEKKEVDNK